MNIHGHSLVLTAVLVAAALSHECYGSEPVYAITAIGLPDGSLTYPQGINERGQLVAISEEAGNYRTFVFEDGDVTILGPQPAGSRLFRPTMNNLGTVVGEAYYDESHLGHAVMWEPKGGFTDLHPLVTLGGYSSGATAINDSGQIAGYSATGDQLTHAFFYTSGSVIDLGTLGGAWSGASALSANGWVVGQSLTATAEQHAFVWVSGQGMKDLGALGGLYSSAKSVNDQGHVVGEAEVDDQHTRHAFLWDERRGMLDLGSPSGFAGRSWAADINNLGQVVGTAMAVVDAPGLGEKARAFLWEEGTGMSDLNALLEPGSGWELNHAQAINDKGWIVGTGMYNGVQAGFLLRPVPEPSSLLALGAGLGSALAALWRRKQHTAR